MQYAFLKQRRNERSSIWFRVEYLTRLYGSFGCGFEDWKCGFLKFFLDKKIAFASLLRMEYRCFFTVYFHNKYFNFKYFYMKTFKLIIKRIIETNWT